MKLRRPLPPTYLLLGLAAMALLHLLLSGPRLIVGVWRLLGAVPIAVGLWLAVSADSLFKRLGTEIKPFRDSRLVVEEGPFGHSRHPMYLGFLAILGGTAVAAGTLAPFLVLAAMAWLFTSRFVLPEERHMEEQFGVAYRDYKARVRRWI
jgi:protein-S-isoprenylcysteine O-methyltransferase Ste14